MFFDVQSAEILNPETAVLKKNLRSLNSSVQDLFIASPHVLYTGVLFIRTNSGRKDLEGGFGRYRGTSMPCQLCVGPRAGGEPWRCPRRRALGGRGDAVAVCQREPTHTPTPRKRMATALELRWRCGRDHKHSRHSSPPKPRRGCEAQAPCGAAGPRRSARIMACSGWLG
jgi:hypothetical protein